MKAGSFSVKTQFAIVMLAYIVFATVFGCAYRYALNPDGLSLLRLAGYIADGNFQWSVTRAWSPLITWLISPFMFIGLDGLTAARITIAICGAGMVMVCWFLIDRFEVLPWLKFITMLVAALLISFWTIQFIASDVLFAVLILLYIYIITDLSLLKNIKTPFLCGIAAGFSYLAHHYALPFFMVHFPSLLLLRGHFEKDKVTGYPWKKVITSWVAGIAGFIMIASVWIGIVSVKYGEFTFSSKGGIAHAVMGPKDVDRRHPFFVGGLFKPKDAYAVHVFEDPSDVKFKTWSPFESREYFIHQLRVIRDNVFYIFDHFINKSPFFNKTFVTGTLLLIPIAFMLIALDDKKRFLYSWVLISFCIYCSGFLLIIARSPRRFYVPMILFVFISVHFLDKFVNAASGILTKIKIKALTYYLLLLVVAAFALKPGIHFIKSLDAITHDQVNPYSAIAEQIQDIPFPAPYAIIRSAQKPHTDTYIAYYLKKQLLGRPASNHIDDITRELKSLGGKTLLVFDNQETVERLNSDDRYVHAADRKLKKDSRYLNAVNIEQDNVEGWDEEVNVFVLK